MGGAAHYLRYGTATGQTGGGGDSLPTIMPVSSQKVYESYGVQIHVNFWDTVYGNIDSIHEKVDQLGPSYIRSMYVDYATHEATKKTVDWCRANGVKWLMLVYPEIGITAQQFSDKLIDIRDNAADVCMAIESINEPNHNRDGTPVASNWAQDAYDITAQIWDFVAASPVLSDAKVVGPSLHDVYVNNSYTQGSPAGGVQHWHQLQSKGILNKQDFAGVHRYPAGFPPLNQWDTRIGQLESAYGAGYPIWVTETGYHNAVNTPSGNRPVDEAASAVYAPRALFELAGQRNARYSRYELMDDYDPAKEEPEYSFGLWRVSSSDQQNSSFWVPKPEVAAMSSVLGALNDPGVTYTPTSTQIRVQPVSSSITDIAYVVTAKRNGTARCWLWRDQSVWNPNARTPISVSSVAVEVEDSVGTRQIQVDASVSFIDLR